MSQTEIVAVTPASLSPQLLQIQHQWPLIARDIAMAAHPTKNSIYTAQQIAKSYQLSEEEFVTLTELPVFKDMVMLEVARLKQLGPFSAHKMRAEAMATDLQELLYLRATTNLMDDRTTLKFLELLTHSAGLGDVVEKKDTTVNNAVGINVTFNVPQLNNPKLRHMTGVSDVVYDAE